MRSLEYRLSSDNTSITFMSRTYEGIDRPDYETIETMTLPGVIRMRKELDEMIEKMMLASTVRVGDHSITVEKARTWLATKTAMRDKISAEITDLTNGLRSLGL